MKKIIPVVIVTLILFGVGGLLLNSLKGKPSLNTVNNSIVNTNNNSNSNVIENIRDALTKSVSFSCQYPDPTGKTKITTYVKNGAIRVKNLAVAENNGGEAIMKDNKMWIWTEGKKEGMILTLNKPDEKTGEQKNQWEEAIKDMEKYKQYCKVEMVSDLLFTPPTDINFQDLDALMKGVGADLMKKTPSITVPTITSE